MLAVLPSSDEEEVLKKLDLTVKEIMRPSPLTVPAGATVMQVANTMEKQDSSCAFIESKGKIIGIVTERDLARRVVGRGASPSKVKVESVMTSPMVATSPDAKIEDALKMMLTNKVRRLPVVDEKTGLADLVSVADIAKALAERAGYTSLLITAMTKESVPPSGVYG